MKTDDVDNQQPFSGPGAPTHRCATCPACLDPGDLHVRCLNCLCEQQALRALDSDACSRCAALPNYVRITRNSFFVHQEFQVVLEHLPGLPYSDDEEVDDGDTEFLPASGAGDPAASTLGEEEESAFLESASSVASLTSSARQLKADQGCGSREALSWMAWSVITTILQEAAAVPQVTRPSTPTYDICRCGQQKIRLIDKFKYSPHI